MATVNYSIGSSNTGDVTLNAYVGDYINIYSYNNSYGVSNKYVVNNQAQTVTVPGCSFELVKSSIYNLKGTVTTAGTYKLRIVSATSSYGTITLVVKAKYTVSYNSQGGSSSPSSQTVNQGSSVTLPSPGTRTGYVFKGWYTASSGGSWVGGQGSSYTVTSNVTLYAQWKALGNINVDGTWKPATPYVNVGGAWKEVIGVYVNVDGNWKEVQ